MRRVGRTRMRILSHSSSSSPEPAGSGSYSVAFGLLHPKVQRWVWRQGWSELRDIQEKAVRPILERQRDVIIAAATASGKTEAAFLPICSHMLEQGLLDSVQVLEVSPLKALINDQFRRLANLCESLGIPVTRWHGDVSQSKKERLLGEPRGLLIITPESLEALFVRRGPYIRRLFASLAYVVIDELHAFIGNERGRQLQSLLARLEQVLERAVPRIALSATLGDMDLAAAFLRPGAPERVLQIVSRRSQQELRLQVRGYRVTTGKPGQTQQGAEGAYATSTLTIARHLYKTLRGGTNLIFANSRRQVETYADLLRRMAEEDRVPNEFFPHHGSLSRELREAVEQKLRDERRPVNAVCTNTLELGIDLGAIESVAQIGPPPSVASLRQRLGRAGRSQRPAILRVYIEEEEITPHTAPTSQLRPRLFQAVAMIELLLTKWYEPPLPERLHGSTLVQQVLSLIAERGGVTAQQAWLTLCRNGPFRTVDPPMFATLLRALGKRELIMQASDGVLLLAPKGERIVNHHSFYAAFDTPEEFRLLHRGKVLGTLPIDYPLTVGSYLIFAGRRWQVRAVDSQHKAVELDPAPAGLTPIFGGGGAMVHDRVRQEMLRLYRSDDPPPRYLDDVAVDLFQEGRANFRRLGLDRVSIIGAGGESFLLPWAGDRVLNTIVLQLQRLGIAAEVADGIAIHATVPAHQLEAAVASLADQGPADGVALARHAENKEQEKYDWALPEELLDLDFAARTLDPQGAWEVLRRVAGVAGMAR